MSSSSHARKICLAAGTAVTASVIAMGGSAQAATHGSITATTPTGHASATSTVTATAGQPATVTFTQKRKPGQVGPLATYSCTIAPPLVNTNQYHQTTWSAGTQCNISLRQQGTTVLFIWGSPYAYAYGTSYDNYAYSEMSTGGPVSTINNTWGVNNNVLLFSPAGYTSTPGYGCYWYDGAHTQIKCTETTGPFTG